jgi:hypothetical protein
MYEIHTSTWHAVLHATSTRRHVYRMQRPKCSWLMCPLLPDTRSSFQCGFLSKLSPTDSSSACVGRLPGCA